MQGINKRIDAYIKHIGKNANSYAVALKIDPVIIYNIIGGRESKPSFELIEKMLSYDNKLNSEWLIMGRQKMFHEPDQLILNEPIEKYIVHNKTPTPVYSDGNVDIIISVQRRK